MFLLVGLGNPGREYELTHHNLGFMVIDSIAHQFSFSSFSVQFSSLVTLGKIAENKVILLKPNTFMNNSGHPVIQVLSFYKIKLDNLIVFHDDIDLKFGDIRIKKGGSSAGHNGLKSIDQLVGQDYWRLRFGVGRPDNQMSISSYVLSKFKKINEVNNLISVIAQNISLLLGENKSLFFAKIHNI